MGGGGNPIGAILGGVSNVANEILSPVAGAIGGQAGKDAVGKVFSKPGQEDAPTAPGEDPRLTEMKKQQNELADSFKANKEGLGANMYDNLAQGERSKLANNIAGVKSNMSRRGLLYSGLEQGAEAGANAQAQSNMAHGRQSINNQIEEKSKQLDATAAGYGLNQAATQGAINDQIYQQALAESNASSSAFGGLMQGAGTLAGGYLAKKNQEK